MHKKSPFLVHEENLMHKKLGFLVHEIRKALEINGSWVFAKD